MTCNDARIALLDAEPAELSSEHSGLLGRHLRTCDACRADAAAILARTDALRSSMAAAVADAAAGATADAAAGATADAASGAPADAASTSDVRSRRRGTRHLVSRVLAPVLLAAGLAAIVLVDADRLRLRFRAQPVAAPYVAAPRVPTTPIVNAGGAAGVAVMHTNDPKITVVWTF